MKWILVGTYIAAAAAANLVIAHYGPPATPFVALGLVALTFVTRDRLHDAFGQHRAIKIAGLILAGSAVSLLVNPAAARIALASALAFAASETVDSLVYHANRRQPWLDRSNRSNIAGAIVDTFVFFGVAFGSFPWQLVAIQIGMKVGGGLLYSMLLAYRRPRVAVA